MPRTVASTRPADRCGTPLRPAACHTGAGALKHRSQATLADAHNSGATKRVLQHRLYGRRTANAR